MATEEVSLLSLKLSRDKNDVAPNNDQVEPPSSIVVRTSDKKPNKLFLFLKKHTDTSGCHLPSYDEAVTATQPAEDGGGGAAEEETKLRQGGGGSPGHYAVRIYENPTARNKAGVYVLSPIIGMVKDKVQISKSARRLQYSEIRKFFARFYITVTMSFIITIPISLH